MSEHPNAALLRKGYAAFGSGDMATVDALFADDVVWHVAGRSPIAGEHKGKEQVFGTFFAALGERSGGTFTIELDYIVADDAHAVAMVRHSASHGGRTLATRDVDVYTIRDGRIVEAWSTGFDPYENDAFWA
jgi:ketosteroid isomerase-like protein